MNPQSSPSHSLKKAFLFSALIFTTLCATAPAQTCREVVRDSSGRIVQTIDRQSQSGGAVQSTIRDASGRMIGTDVTSASAFSSS